MIKDFEQLLFIKSGYRVAICATRSDGADGAFVVYVDTNFEPDGSDGGPGLRVSINDDDTIFVGTPYKHKEE